MIIPEVPITSRTQSCLDVLGKYEGIHSLTYVGERKKDLPYWWHSLCLANNWDWRLVEVFKANADACRNVIDRNKVICANIMDYDSYWDADVLIFWHGPEHIEKDEYIDSLPCLEAKARLLIIFGMPLGKLSQGILYGNQWERHLSAWEPEEWGKLGYDTDVLIDDGGPGKGHITAWKAV